VYVPKAKVYSQGVLYVPRTKNRIRKADIRRLMRKAVGSAKRYREIGGLLIDNGHFLQLREMRNVSKREGSFVLDSREINSVTRAAEKLDLAVVGTFHSHIAWYAKPGEGDINGAEDNSMMLIFDPVDREARLWRIQNNRAYALTFEVI
jgi:proteasome lid subunit RPN8/RPN11